MNKYLFGIYKCRDILENDETRQSFLNFGIIFYFSVLCCFCLLEFFL